MATETEISKGDLTQRLKAALEFETARACKMAKDCVWNNNPSDNTFMGIRAEHTRTHALVMAMVSVIAEVNEAQKTIDMNTITNGASGCSGFSANRMLEALDRLKLELDKLVPPIRTMCKHSIDKHLCPECSAKEKCE